LCAWGSTKRRLQKEYSNVHYLDDRYAHARCHNALLKAKTVVILGTTFEAYQTAASARDYLDSVGYVDTEIILMSEDGNKSEVLQSFGPMVQNAIHKMLKDKRISVLMDSTITKINGVNRIDEIHFMDAEEHAKSDAFSEQGIVEYFLKPDVVIAENGLGAPKVDI